MLVLSRTLGESILIGKDVRITVVDVDQHKVRIGIQAPREVPIYREEILPQERRSKGADGKQDYAPGR